MKMKRLFSTAVVALSLSLLSATSTMADEVDDAVRGLQTEWGIANYKTSDENKEAAFKALVDKAEALSGKYTARAEPKIWEAIIRAGYAGAMGGLSALSEMERGRDLLLEAEKIDATALNGSIYTTLGSFHYMVPGWPIGFGDNDEAEVYLAKALEVAPDDMDANYFTGDYWLERKKYKKAIPYLDKVLALPDVAERPIYSEGRKAEAAAKLAIAKKKAPPF